MRAYFTYLCSSISARKMEPPQQCTGCILVMHSHCQRSLLTPGHDTIASAIAWPWASSRPLLYKARALSRHKAARSHHTVWFHVLSSRKPRMLLGIMKTSNAVKVCCLPLQQPRLWLKAGLHVHDCQLFSDLLKAFSSLNWTETLDGCFKPQNTLLGGFHIDIKPDIPHVLGSPILGHRGHTTIESRDSSWKEILAIITQGRLAGHKVVGEAGAGTSHPVQVLQSQPSKCSSVVMRLGEAII